jgi:hypothetical protein
LIEADAPRLLLQLKGIRQTNKTAHPINHAQAIRIGSIHSAKGRFLPAIIFAPAE